MRAILTGWFLAQFALTLAQTNASPSPVIDPSPFASITPSDSLEWHPCPNAFLSEAVTSNSSLGIAGARLECARLIVPLDYNNPNTTSKKVVIAAIRLPATDKQNYRGPIFFNFGGPGGTGTVSVAFTGHVLQGRVGAGYDIVSWDPRAVGSTLPALSCYRDDAARIKSSFFLRRIAFAANDTLVRADAEYEAIAKGCEKLSGSILPYMGTMGTVHDLHRLVDTYGYSKKLSYYGASYGSVLGATYAALWPEQVERMVLDGIVNPTNWYTDPQDVSGYADTEAALEDFFRLCSLAGPSRCRIWRPTQEEIKEAFWNLDKRLYSLPVVLPSLEVVDWSAWRIAALASLYGSIFGFSSLGDIAAAASRQNFTEAANLMLPNLDITIGRDRWLTDPETGLKNGEEAILAISCLDKPPSTVTDAKKLEEFLKSERVQELSPLALSGVGLLGTVCGRLDTSTAERFNGTFADIKTSAPVLFLSTKFDPVTPLRSAVSTIKGFRNAALLTVNATGHTSGSSISTCVDDYTRQYFQNGTLPTNGTVCQPELLGFGLLPDGTPANVTVLQRAVQRLTGQY